MAGGRTGGSAAITLTAQGAAASDINQEVDLAIAASGETLATDLDGDPLAITPAVLWTGVSAAEIA